MKHQFLIGSALTLAAWAVSSEEVSESHSDFTRRLAVGAKTEKPAGKTEKPAGKTAKDATYSKASKAGVEDFDHYYLAPFACPGKCIDADGANLQTGALDSAVMTCSTRASLNSHTQQWRLHMSNDIVQVESSVYLGECIAVSYMPGDLNQTIGNSCRRGTLKLLPCDNPGSLWYFSGEQLLSFLCWARGGVSTTMSVSSTCDKFTGYSTVTNTTKMAVQPAQATFMLITAEDMNLLPLDQALTQGPTFTPTYFPTRT